MRKLAPGLWTFDAPLRFLGLELGARMTVVRLADGTLLLHSPIQATDDVVASVRALGPVSTIVAPNRFHHLFVGEWQHEFPDAATYVAPGIEVKRRDLSIAGLLDDAPIRRLEGTLDHRVLRGIPATNEVLFFHRESGTLLASDLAFNIDGSSPALTRGFFRMGGCFGRLTPTPLERIFVRDRAAFGESLRAALAWPFERVVVAHGAIAETGGRESLEHGYAWVLGSRGA